MTLSDCLNEDGSPRSGMKEKWQEIQSSIRQVFDAAAEWLVCYGEAQIIVLNQFGKTIKNIDENNFENIRQWFKNNGFRRMQILDKKIHSELMQSENEYSKWFNLHEAKNQSAWQDKF